MDPTLKIFLIGTGSALAPEVVRLYTIAQSGKPFTWTWFYVIVSIVFACMGGLIVAFVLPPLSTQGAFYAGVATPTFINTALKKAGGNNRRNKVNKDIAAERPLSRFDSFVEGL